MRSSALARLSACSTLLVTATLSAPALGFAPRATPWASTPERFLATQPDHPRAKVSAALVEAGLVPASFRPDGAVALAYRAAGAEAQANLRPEAAGEAALVFGRAAAESFGVAPEALELASVHPLTGRTSVYLAQRYEGLPVRGGFLLVSFRGGVITSVRNELMAGLAVPAEPALDAGDAGLLAADAVRAWAPGAGVKGAPALVVWLGGDRPEDARLAWAVEVSTPAPRAELTVHVDALSGAVLAVDDALRFAEGEGRIRMVVHRVNPSEGSEPITVPFLAVGNQVTDGDGEIVAPGGQTVTYSGSRVVIDDQGGQQNERMQVNLAGPFQVYDVTPSNTQQADPFVHLNLVKAWASQLTPTLPWLSQRLTSNVNLNDTCNAYWDGETVNFFRSGGGCNNTGQISSIVYHEFGHGYHQNLTRNVVGSVGEGTGDFLAATVLDDPVVGRGFATNGGGIRRIDADRVYPDDYVNEVHEDGLIWASALWDLREAMMDKHGDWAGRLMVDRIFIYALALGPGLSTAYPSVLEADDDDGDVNNGTPNSCEINAIFNAHGLVDGGAINHSLVPTGAYARILHDAPGRVSADDKGEVVLTAGVENRASCGQVDLQNLQAFWAPGLEGGLEPGHGERGGDGGAGQLAGARGGYHLPLPVRDPGRRPHLPPRERGQPARGPGGPGPHGHQGRGLRGGARGVDPRRGGLGPPGRLGGRDAARPRLRSLRRPRRAAGRGHRSRRGRPAGRHRRRGQGGSRDVPRGAAGAHGGDGERVPRAVAAPRDGGDVQDLRRRSATLHPPGRRQHLERRLALPRLPPRRGGERSRGRGGGALRGQPRREQPARWLVAGRRDGERHRDPAAPAPATPPPPPEPTPTPTPEQPAPTPTPEQPAETPGPLDLHRNTIGGGCTCAVPGSELAGSWAFWMVLLAGVALKRRR
ncbi:MAG: M36 family metallopeptidase [Deltaproteobacteria bacterium]|nr:M36 family metallopeptidase [Deltaproteobacteria bacterium]